MPAARVARCIAVALAAVLFSAGAPAQNYPTKPIRIVDAFAPGGTTDILARHIASNAKLGQPIYVESKTGANGIIGSEAAARAAPDGYTMFVGSTSTLAVNQSLYKLKFDPLKDFDPVALLVAQPLILVVHPSIPVKSVKELVAYAKANPTKLNYATPGIGNPLHLAMELFKKMTDTSIEHIPYNKGSAAALPDLLAGRAHMMFAPMYFLPHVRSGKLRALAISGPNRSPLLPDVPTVAEAGVPGYEVTIWNAAVVPAGTPKDIVRILNAEIVRIFNLPDVRKQLAATGLEVIVGTPDEQAKFTRAEVQKWADVIKEAGIKLQQ